MKQRGNELIVYGVVVLAALAAVAGAVLYVQHVRASALKAGTEQGRREALLEVAQRDNKQLVAARAEIARLQARVDKLEAEHQEEVARIDKEGQDALRAKQAEHNRFLDDLVAGRIRLPGQGRDDGGCAPGGDEPEGTALAGAGVDHGEAGAVIPAGFGEFLVAQAKRADKVAIQLRGAQALIVEDRKTCNGGP